MVNGAGLERFQIADNRCQRRSDFMRHVDNKIRPNSFKFLEPGHVMKYNHFFFI